MEININQEVKKETKFDPTKNYEWKPDATFTFSGTEFAMLNRHLLSFLSNPITPSTIIMIRDLFVIVNDKLKKAVESGDATEMSKPQEPIVSTEDNI